MGTPTPVRDPMLSETRKRVVLRHPLLTHSSRKQRREDGDQHASQPPGGDLYGDWVAAKEFELRYCKKETLALVFTIYPSCGNLIQVFIRNPSDRYVRVLRRFKRTGSRFHEPLKRLDGVYCFVKGFTVASDWKHFPGVFTRSTASDDELTTSKKV